MWFVPQPRGSVVHAGAAVGLWMCLSELHMLLL
jgi:hypothetical protein